MKRNINNIGTKVTDAEVVKRVRSAVQLDIDKKKAMNIPVAVYDAETGNVYATYGDGRRELLSSRLRKGSYSEQTGN